MFMIICIAICSASVSSVLQSQRCHDAGEMYPNTHSSFEVGEDDFLPEDMLHSFEFQPQMTNMAESCGFNKRPPTYEKEAASEAKRPRTYEKEVVYKTRGPPTSEKEVVDKPERLPTYRKEERKEDLVTSKRLGTYEKEQVNQTKVHRTDEKEEVDQTYHPISSSPASLYKDLWKIQKQDTSDYLAVATDESIGDPIRAAMFRYPIDSRSAFQLNNVDMDASSRGRCIEDFDVIVENSLNDVEKRRSRESS